MSVGGLGLPVEFVLTAGQESDVGQAKALIADHPAEAVVAYKGYDGDEPVEHVESRGAEAVIPPGKNRREKREYDAHLYEQRNLVERFWHKAKQFRRGGDARREVGPQLAGLRRSRRPDGTTAVGGGLVHTN